MESQAGIGMNGTEKVMSENATPIASRPAEVPLKMLPQDQLHSLFVIAQAINSITDIDQVLNSVMISRFRR